MRTVALVHDLIPLRLRGHYSAEAVTMFEKYMENFSRNDAVLATTKGVADELRAFLEQRLPFGPPISVVPLPAQFGDHSRVTEVAVARRESELLKLVALVSWERRKNIVRLLRRSSRLSRRAMPPSTLLGRKASACPWARVCG